jgi:hypothetical protein
MSSAGAAPPHRAELLMPLQAPELRMPHRWCPPLWLKWRLGCTGPSFAPPQFHPAPTFVSARRAPGRAWPRVLLSNHRLNRGAHNVHLAEENIGKSAAEQC